MNVVAAPSRAGMPAALATAAEVLGSEPTNVRCELEWHAPGDSHPGAEATVQALACLAALHGDAGGAPRRLRLDVASVAAGVVTAQGILAARVAAARGAPVALVRTSVLSAALLYVSHHVAVASAALVDVPRGRSATAPPFVSADGRWFELEALTFESWAAVWHELGAQADEAEAGWASFARRYVLGSCKLPARLHALTRLQPFSEIAKLASSRGVLAVPTRAAPAAACPVWRMRLTGGAAPLHSAPPDAGLPLNGVRVVELTTRLQGPLAGRLLAQLGAEVVKIEPPGGDPGRLAPAGPFRAAYLAYNHGKRIVELDYRTAAGREQLDELVAGADAFLHNARPGRAERQGFDAVRLGRLRPGLVHLHLAGWDRRDPDPDAIAGDYVVQAASGIACALADDGEPPRPSPLTLLDVLGGLLGGAAVLSGLLRRERHGRGCSVTTSLSGAASLLIRYGSRQPGPLEQPLATGDGWLAIGMSEHAGRSPLGGRDPSSRSAAEWESELAAAGVAAAAVRSTPASLPDDPRVGPLLEPVADGVYAPGAPWRFGDERPAASVWD